MRDHTHPASAFHAVALVAAARTALHAARAIADRRAGRDASAQEPEGDVRSDLGGLQDALAHAVVRLRLRALIGTPEVRAAALAQAFEDRVLLDDTARTLGTIHQKLLSLYPAVDAGLVEAVRQTAAAAARRAVADAYGADLGAFAARVAEASDRLREVLSGPRPGPRVDGVNGQ